MPDTPEDRDAAAGETQRISVGGGRLRSSPPEKRAGPEASGSQGAATGEIQSADLVGTVVVHLGEATDCYAAARALSLGLAAWMDLGSTPITAGQRTAVLAAVAGARPAIAVGIPQGSLARVEDGFNALAEHAAAASGVLPFGSPDQAVACQTRIALAQAEAAVVAMLIKALFDDPSDRSHALAHASDWEARSIRLAAEIARQTPRMPAIRDEGTS